MAMMVKDARARDDPIVPKTLRPPAPRSRTDAAKTRKASIISRAGYIHRKSRGTNCAAVVYG
jgi:hypothetical protein